MDEKWPKPGLEELAGLLNNVTVARQNWESAKEAYEAASQRLAAELSPAQVGDVLTAEIAVRSYSRPPRVQRQYMRVEQLRVVKTVLADWKLQAFLHRCSKDGTGNMRNHGSWEYLQPSGAFGSRGWRKVKEGSKDG